MSNEEEIQKIKVLISLKEEEIRALKIKLNGLHNNDILSTTKSSVMEKYLSQEEISRYGRQLILPEIGVNGQLLLKQASVLIVGAGGLGCPIGLYLAASGVGHIGIADHDSVDVSNLHRQIAHEFKSVGQNKSASLQSAISKINPLVKCTTYPELLTSNNIENVIDSYEIIIDASDNIPTRYLLNDASVLFNKYLVSGSALKFEGQLTVYNYLDGPCYRCLFPKPPLSNFGNCSENGILGIVTGVIGLLQALEVIKIIIGIHPTYYKKMLLFDALNGDIRAIKLRSKKMDCEVCGTNPSVKHLIDYELFCQQSPTDKINDINILPDSERITCEEYKKILDSETVHLLLDVRPIHEVEICSLPNSINIPVDEIMQDHSIQKLKEIVDERNSYSNFVICRRGNDSQTAVLNLKTLLTDCEWKDIKGGLIAWHNEIDSSFPIYFS